MAAFSLHHLATLASINCGAPHLETFDQGVRTSAPVWPKFANVS
jgi:hypothetical protein